MKDDKFKKNEAIDMDELDGVVGGVAVAQDGEEDELEICGFAERIQGEIARGEREAPKLPKYKRK